MGEVTQPGDVQTGSAGSSSSDQATDSEVAESDPTDLPKSGSGSPVMPLPLKGRLRSSLQFWREELQAPPFVLGIIESGYVLPLKAEPTPYSRKNQVSAFQNGAFVQESINDLLATGCILEVPSAPHIRSPLSVVVSSSGKKRLVVNLRHLNRFLWKQKFKYEDLRVAMALFEKGDYLFSFDLKSGYHHVDIRPIHYTYLGFEWGQKFYAFTVLPFGLATACYMFTKLMRPLVRYWRARGLRVVVYLDDSLGAAVGEQSAKDASELVSSTLAGAGFVAHPVKSRWRPTQRLIWLGFVIDTALGQIEVPQEKLTALRSMLDEARRSECIRARRLASIVGRIISMSLAFGPVSRLMTRSLYAVLEARHAWCSSLQEYNAQPIWHSPSAVRVVYSDASDTGYGGYVVEHGNCVSYGLWTADEAKQSSTWRELAAVHLVLKSVAPKLVNCRVRWFTDNQNVSRILVVGSRKPLLHAIALKVFSLVVSCQIHLEPEWIPRGRNEQADYLSRIVDYDDWFLNPLVFVDLDRAWGPHTVDRFADANNRQVQRFNSRCWNPGTEAVDAFTVNWADENNWLCPPIALIPRVIGHARACKAVGTLVVPCWPSSSFWPILHPSPTSFAPFVLEVRELPMFDQLFVPGLSGSNLFKTGKPDT